MKIIKEGFRERAETDTYKGRVEMIISIEDMKGCIQEWLAQAQNFEDLRDIYYAVRAEADLQFNIMADIIAKEFDN